ncbi:MAG: 8-oxo-dGTP diphosphatase [Clostridia bacterium]|nr:8-oxo-dGTP diphosphatase [Clostridia bacterium]
MAELAVFTNMCVIERDGYVLMQERADKNWPGVAFPGGHVELGESFTEAVKREVREETGLTIADPELCGVKQFWDDDGARYVVFLYRTSSFTGELRSSEEGRVFWVKKEDVGKMRLPNGVRPMLPVFFGDFPRELFWRGGGFELL